MTNIELVLMGAWGLNYNQHELEGPRKIKIRTVQRKYLDNVNSSRSSLEKVIEH